MTFTALFSKKVFSVAASVCRSVHKVDPHFGFGSATMWGFSLDSSLYMETADEATLAQFMYNVNCKSVHLRGTIQHWLVSYVTLIWCRQTHRVSRLSDGWSCGHKLQFVGLLSPIPGEWPYPAELGVYQYRDPVTLPHQIMNKTLPPICYAAEIEGSQRRARVTWLC